jgi:hypothetical protein
MFLHCACLCGACGIAYFSAQHTSWLLLHLCYKLLACAVGVLDSNMVSQLHNRGQMPVAYSSNVLTGAHLTAFAGCCVLLASPQCWSCACQLQHMCFKVHVCCWCLYCTTESACQTQLESAYWCTCISTHFSTTEVAQLKPAY